MVSMMAAGAAHAGGCDWTPSKLVGKAGSAAAGLAGSSAAAGIGLNAAGYYTLVHSTSGLTMLGSTAAGTSAAGTVGIIAGTGGAIGTVAGILMAPVTIVAGAVTFAAAGAYEGYCYFQVDRVTDPYEVREIVENAVAGDPAVRIVRTDAGPAMEIATEAGPKTYLLRQLYIEDGELRHRDWGPNTRLGQILLVRKARAEE